MVETYARSPKGDVAKLAAMKPAERDTFFKEYAEERCKDLQLNGIYIFACRNPGFVRVQLYGQAAAKLPSGFGSVMSRKLLESFREKKYDEGLKEALDLVLDTKGLGEKDKEKK